MYKSRIYSTEANLNLIFNDTVCSNLNIEQ